MRRACRSSAARAACSWTRRCRDEELAAVRAAIEEFGSDEVVGFHKLRARRAGSRRYIDLHVQFRAGTTLERAHELAHELQREIRGALRGADVLIHLEPETSRRD